MKIELKNIKHMASLSEETLCYNASLYVDGKKIGQVSNHGHGGPDMFHGDQQAFDRAGTWLKEKTETVDVGEMSIPNDMEIHCGNLVNNWLMEKDLKKTLRNRVLYVEKDSKDIYQIKWKGVRKIEERHIAAAASKHPNATILNSLPLNKAMEIWLSNAQ